MSPGAALWRLSGSTARIGRDSRRLWRGYASGGTAGRSRNQRRSTLWAAAYDFGSSGCDFRDRVWRGVKWQPPKSCPTGRSSPATAPGRSSGSGPGALQIMPPRPQRPISRRYVLDGLGFCAIRASMGRDRAGVATGAAAPRPPTAARRPRVAQPETPAAAGGDVLGHNAATCAMRRSKAEV